MRRDWSWTGVLLDLLGEGGEETGVDSGVVETGDWSGVGVECGLVVEKAAPRRPPSSPPSLPERLGVGRSGSGNGAALAVRDCLLFCQNGTDADARGRRGGRGRRRRADRGRGGGGHSHTGQTNEASAATSQTGSDGESRTNGEEWRRRRRRGHRHTLHSGDSRVESAKSPESEREATAARAGQRGGARGRDSWVATSESWLVRGPLGQR